MGQMTFILVAARPPPKLVWTPSELDLFAENRLSVSILKRETIEAKTVSNSLSCHVEDQVIWSMDTLRTSKKEATLFLNQPKWPRKSTQIPEMGLIYASSSLVGGTQTYQVQNLPKSLQNVTIIKYERLDATNPSPVSAPFGLATLVEKVGIFTLTWNLDNQLLTITIADLIMIGDFYFSLKFYDNYGYFIGESNIFQLSVFAEEKYAVPVVDTFDPIVLDDGKFYLIAICSQPDTYPLKKIQFADSNGLAYSPASIDKEVGLYMNANQAVSLDKAPLVSCQQLDSNDEVISETMVDGKPTVIMRPTNIELELGIDRDEYLCSFDFESNDFAPTCSLDGSLESFAYRAKSAAVKNADKWSCTFEEDFTKAHSLTCTVRIPGFDDVSSTVANESADATSVVILYSFKTT